MMEQTAQSGRREDGIRVSGGGVQPVPGPAAGGGGGVFGVFRGDVRGDLRAAGVERAGRTRGELRGHVPLCWAAGGSAGAGGGAAGVRGCVGEGEGEDAEITGAANRVKAPLHVSHCLLKASGTWRGRQKGISILEYVVQNRGHPFRAPACPYAYKGSRPTILYAFATPDSITLLGICST